MGIIDLHFHDSEFAPVAHLGKRYEGTGESTDTEATEGGDSGRCLVRLAVAALVVVGVLGVAAFLVKRTLGGGSAETTLSEFEEADGDADVA